MLGQQPQLRAQEPTTDGVIALLSGLDLRGRRIGLQLYPDAGDRLVKFLEGAGPFPTRQRPTNTPRVPPLLSGSRSARVAWFVA